MGSGPVTWSAQQRERTRTWSKSQIPVKTWRNTLLDMLATPEIEAILAFGAGAHQVVDLWPGAAGRFVAPLTHPSAKNDAATLQNWNQNEVARARGDCQRDWAALIDEFAAMRSESVALVAGLQETDLERGGRHPKVGLLRVRDLLHEWVHHDRNHIRQMLANVQAVVWPHMGNAQRFSGD